MSYMSSKGDVGPDFPGDPAKEWAVRGLEPSYATYNTIPHYYGDVVRGLLLGAAALLLIASPLYADAIRSQFPFLVFGAFCAVTVAAFTDPHKKLSLMADATVAGAGLIVYAGWGLLGYDGVNPTAFVLRLAVAVLFLFAFYFSLKTVRAFALHEVGKDERFVAEENPDRKNS